MLQLVTWVPSSVSLKQNFDKLLLYVSKTFIYKLRIISIEIKEIENIADNQG